MSLFVSPSGQDRLDQAVEWLSKQDRSSPLLILAHRPGGADDLVRRVVGDGGAAFGWHRMTLWQAATALAGPGMKGRVASGLTERAVLTRSVDRLRREGAIGRFEAVVETPGFPPTVARTIQEARLAALSADDVRRGCASLGQLVAAFEAELGTTDLADLPEILMAASAALAEGSQSPLVGVPTLFLDVTLENTLATGFAEALLDRCSEWLATVPLGDKLSEAAFQSMREATNGSETNGSVQSGPFTQLQTALFDDAAEGLAIEEAPEGLHIFAEAGEHLECVELARRILQASREGVRFDAMAVLLNAPEIYRPHLEEALDRADVPAYFSVGVTRPDPAGRALMSLIACAAEQLSARRFAEYLSLGQVPDAGRDGSPKPADPEEQRWRPPQDERLQSAVDEQPAGKQLNLFELGVSDDAEQAPVAAGTLRAPRRWERLLVEAAVIGELGRWERRLAGLMASLKMKLETRDDLGEAEQRRFEREVDDLKSLTDFALPLLSDLSRFSEPVTWGGWVDRLSALASRALRDPERVLGVLGELAPMGNVGPVGIDEVQRVLSPHMLLLTVTPDGDRYGKVFVGPIEAARGRAFDVVFVPGLAERVFPSKVVQEPILSDRVRASLSDRLVTNRDRVVRERLSLRLAMGAARCSLVLSYPRVDLEHTRKRVSSFYALEVYRAAMGILPTVRELETWSQEGRTTRPGWPAPGDRNQAIDAAEYDLAVLDKLLEQSEKEASGAGRFLLSANTHLARSLRWRWMRHANDWTGSDGLMIRKRLDRGPIKAHRLSQRVYSPTALQAFAACPYKFFLHGIQRLSPREEAEAIERMDPLQRGSLVHDVQYATLTALRDRHLLPVTSFNLQHAYDALSSSVDAVASDYRDRLAPAIDRVWVDGVDGIHADLREWLLRMSEDTTGFVPWRFELSFGLSERELADPHSQRESVELKEGFSLRGCIDVVERHADGGLRVTDHKTGKVRLSEGAIVAGGESLQPLLYSLAVEQILPEAKALQARLYYATATGGFTERGFDLDGDAQEIARQVARTIDAAVVRGQLPSAPKEGACRFCDFRPICGHGEEGRTKNKPDIPSLTWLRSLT